MSYRAVKYLDLLIGVMGLHIALGGSWPVFIIMTIVSMWRLWSFTELIGRSRDGSNG